MTEKNLPFYRQNWGVSLLRYIHWEATAPFFARYQAQMEFGEARDIIDFLTQHEDFNIKGRTLKSMRRIVQQWHEELAQSWNDINNINQSWERTGEGDYYFDKEHVITELTTGKQLHWEGQFQRHCVSAYTDQCATGNVAIWSLRKILDKELEKPMVTIEVKGKEIVQIKGKLNRQPNELEILMIHEWAKERNLEINSGWW